MEETRRQVQGKLFGPYFQVRKAESYALGLYCLWEARSIGSYTKASKDYVNLILSGPLWDLYQELSEERGAVQVMEDGAPIHHAKIAQAFHTSNLWTF